jgi:hypothetical protein
LSTSLTFEYSFLWAIPCLIAAFLYAYFLYKNDFKNEDAALYKYRKWLSGFRFLLVFFLLFLLLTPFIKTKKTDRQKPIIAILADKSESIRNGFKNKADTTWYLNKIKSIADNLSDKYEVVVYGIGDNIEQRNPEALTGKATNLSAAFEMINDVYYNRNIGAVILASDGIFNQGINPLYITENSCYEIYTINLGDTTIPIDVKVDNVFYNKIAYLNDQLTIKSDFSATNASGNNVNLSLFEIENGQRKIIDKKSVFINSDNFIASYDFAINANKTGVLHYQIIAAEIKNEVSYSNNIKDIYVEVLDGRQKVLLVASSPHPDIAALRKAIESNKNYTLDVVFADEFNAKLNEYSLVILHQIPSSNANSSSVIAQVKGAKKPVWWVVGSGTNVNQLNKEQTLVTINGSSNKFNDVSPNHSKYFSLFVLSEQTLTALNKFPPLSCFFGDYKSNPSVRVLFNQKINNVKTDFSLMGFIDDNDVKHAILSGEGLWRWKLYDFLQNQNNDAFNEIVSKTIQYLAVVSDKRPFRVNVAKSVFDENEAINMDAQLYNASFELVNTPDIELKVFDEAGKRFDYKFNKSENAYTLNLGFLPAGNYKYQARTGFSGQVLTTEGKFSVAQLQLEDSRTIADHNLLRQLSLNHNGISVNLSEVKKIEERLLNSDKLKTVLYDSYSTESAINLFWIFCILIGLLSFEWILRKYTGAY